MFLHFSKGENFTKGNTNEENQKPLIYNLQSFFKTITSEFSRNLRLLRFLKNKTAPIRILKIHSIYIIHFLRDKKTNTRPTYNDSKLDLKIYPLSIRIDAAQIDFIFANEFFI
ncbi:hypothetical protein LEP1GSC060_2561 [Leptospira weilii serovar Ranarum str. ICFT]|uniref:Uncharacterized protein n=1 Tax=Leptospira weilii serovar Ranarum str. ICFT TaxID=1218598 RepID=N1WGM2_9LEPT|nr:hypothetical protein LEP1GSC060_2561 [Leptospira weilii serovar Ranarum str. ICFT]